MSESGFPGLEDVQDGFIYEDHDWLNSCNIIERVNWQKIFASHRQLINNNPENPENPGYPDSDN